jgi:hypothetical protein
MWLVEMSTRKGYLELTTTNANNEKFTYDIKLDPTTAGNLMIKDSDANQIELNSTESRITLKNKNLTEISLTKKKIYGYAAEDITIVSDGTLNAKVKKDTNIDIGGKLTAVVTGESLLDCAAKVTITAPEIQLGESGAVQPSILGTNHAASHAILEAQINASMVIGNLGVPTSTISAVVPVGVPSSNTDSGSDYSKVNTNQ